MGVRRGRRRQGDHPDARAAHQGPRDRRHGRGGLRRAATPTRSRPSSASTARPRCTRPTPATRCAAPVGAALLADRSSSEQPDLVLFAQSYDGRDAMRPGSRPSSTARCSRTATASRSTATPSRSATAVFGGNTIVDRRVRGRQARTSPPSGRSRSRPSPAAAARPRSCKVDGVDAGRAGEAKVLDHHVEEQEGPKLEEAEVVVSGGRGLGERRELRAAGRRAGQAAQGRVRRVACDRRRRLGALRASRSARPARR